MENSTKIKICGLFRDCDVDYANQVRPDYIGFVFAKRRRQVTREQAARYRKLLSPDIVSVGVFLNAPIDQVIGLLRDGIIDMAQLHGDETEEDVRAIQAATGKPVIKAVTVRERADVEAWLDSQADYLLFDSGTGTGKVFDWTLLQNVDRPFFLAGGLNPENIPEAIARMHPYAIDLSSGVETDGVKDCEKMLKAVQAVRSKYK